MQRKLDGSTLQAILFNGQTAGMWTRQADGQSSLVEARLREHLSSDDLDSVESEGRDLAQWLTSGIDVVVGIEEPTIASG